MKRFIILALFMIHGLFSQDFFYKCGYNNSSAPHIPSSQFKPLKTLPVTDTSVFFRVLMVFVEFQSDENWSPESQYWPPNSYPRYIDSIFSPVKNPGGYTRYIISDYFDAVTRNQSDIIGDVYHLILPHSYEYYRSVYGNDSRGRDAANLDVLKMLDTNLCIDWNRYDIWRWDGSDFVRQPDNYIDFIYIQYRRGKPDFFSLSSGGHADLKVDYSTIQQSKFIKQGTSYISSGIYGINGSSEPLEVVLDYFVHEYCHYLLGMHRPYSRISGEEGTELALGWERAFSPQDEISLELADVTDVNFENSFYTLPDFITTGQVLRINSDYAVGNYFLICNRQRLVKYDCNTGGDTVAGRFFGSAGEYDKGVYIYQVFYGDNPFRWCDLECADGLWNWNISGYTTPDWSNDQLLPLFEKKAAGRLNDIPFDLYNDTNRLYSRDGLSVSGSDPLMTYLTGKWFSTGKRHQFLGDPGMDRMFTNYQENWCSRELLGDRYDVWKVGYNEVFSPFSSPNTMEISFWSQHTYSGVFVYIYEQQGNLVNLRIFKTGKGGYTEADILRIIPPARPMFFKLFWQNTANGMHPRLIWDNNTEPDMLRTGNFKRYNVFRALSTDFNAVPVNYTWLKTYDDYTPNDTAGIIDYSVSYNENNSAAVYYRYYIKAIDNTNQPSVPSDFLSIADNTPNNPGIQKNTENFYLNSNYPNPFNAETKIRFVLPPSAEKGAIVRLIVYDILGREITVLVDKHLEQGTYEVIWNAGNCSSGVYYYRLTAGNYSETKKMVLMK